MLAIQRLICDICYCELTGATRGINHTVDDRHIFGRAVQHVTCHIEYLLSYTFSSYLDAPSADIGGAGRIRTIVKYAGIGINGVHDDLLHTYTQRLCSDLSQDGVAALPDIGRPGHHIERAVFVELNGCSPQLKAGNATALHSCSHATSAADRFAIPPVKWLMPAKGCHALFQALGQTT